MRGLKGRHGEIDRKNIKKGGKPRTGGVKRKKKKKSQEEEKKIEQVLCVKDRQEYVGKILLSNHPILCIEDTFF